MNFARQNAFIGAFLLALALTFATQAHVWPFMAYDMYARRDIPTFQFVGITAKGVVVPIQARRYFRYYPGNYFSMGLAEILRVRPAQFAQIASELRERYNRDAQVPLTAVRATLMIDGVSTNLGEFR